MKKLTFIILFFAFIAGQVSLAKDAELVGTWGLYSEIAGVVEIRMIDDAVGKVVVKKRKDGSWVNCGTWRLYCRVVKIWIDRDTFYIDYHNDDKKNFGAGLVWVNEIVSPSGIATPIIQPVEKAVKAVLYRLKNRDGKGAE